MDPFSSHLLFKKRLRIIGSMIARAAAFCVPVFLVFWPITVGLLIIGQGTRSHYNHWPTPQLVKLLFGAVLGAVITPAVAYLALVRMGWKQEQRVVIAHGFSASGSQISSIGDDGGVSFPAISSDTFSIHV
jgi:hypothetical protein